MNANVKMDVKPNDSPWLIPMVTVDDVKASLDFYENIFGFTTGMSMPDSDGNIIYANMQYKNNLVIMLKPEGAWESTALAPKTNGLEAPVSMYVYCDDIDALHVRAKESGVEIVNEPEDMFWGDRTSVMKDLNGHIWTFATKVADFSPENATA